MRILWDEMLSRLCWLILTSDLLTHVRVKILNNLPIS